MTTRSPTVGAHTYSIATQVVGQSTRTDERFRFRVILVPDANSVKDKPN
jgi:hypothetical protein